MTKTILDFADCSIYAYTSMFIGLHRTHNNKYLSVKKNYECFLAFAASIFFLTRRADFITESHDEYVSIKKKTQKK